MTVNIIAVLILVSIVAALHRFNPFLAGLVMTFPIITIASIIFTDTAETKRFISGALSGIVPLTAMLIVYLLIHQKFLKVPAVCLSFLVWCVTAAAQFLLFGRTIK